MDDFTQQQETGIDESALTPLIPDHATDADYKRRLIKAGTEAVLEIGTFSYVQPDARPDGSVPKPYIATTYKVVAPNVVADGLSDFDRRYYLSRVPAPGKRKWQTAWARSVSDLTSLIAGVRQKSKDDPEIDGWMAPVGLLSKGKSETETYHLIVDQLNAVLRGASVPVILGIEQGGDFPDKQTIAAVAHPGGDKRYAKANTLALVTTATFSDPTTLEHVEAVKATEPAPF